MFIIRRLISLFRGVTWDKDIYVISDTHFEHKNIIKYCKRPFKNTRQMDETIVRRWNKTVKPRDTVYFLGDFVHGSRREKSPGYWLRRLNGRKKLIRGNHDRRIRGASMSKTIRYKGYNIILTHNHP